MLEDIHQRDQPAVAPADDAHALGVEEIVFAEHPLATGKNVVHFPPAIVDLFVKSAAVSGAAAIIGGDHRIALLH